MKPLHPPNKPGRSISICRDLFYVPRVATAGLIFVLLLACDANSEKIMRLNENETRHERGVSALSALDPNQVQVLTDHHKDLSPEMAQFVIDFAYGDIYSRPGLDPRSRQIATIAALTAMGNAGPQLKFHMACALNIGMKPREIIEVLYVTTVFSGFPSGLNGVTAAREVFQEKGVTVQLDKPATSPQEDRRTRGLATLNKTSKDAGEKVVNSLADIAPDMAGFIIDFSYGDVFSRDIISPKEKEITMIAVCVAKGTMQPQMKVHLHAAFNVGCTREEITELMYHMAVYSGFPAALNGLTAVREVLEERKELSRENR